MEEEVKNVFYPLTSAAICKKLTTWESSLQSSIALVLLLDQFPRIIFRGTRDECAGHSEALRVSLKALERWDGPESTVSTLSPEERFFLHMPLIRDHTNSPDFCKVHQRGLDAMRSLRSELRASGRSAATASLTASSDAGLDKLVDGILCNNNERMELQHGPEYASS
jgi:uncharacterized protein (DUF924 family)